MNLAALENALPRVAAAIRELSEGATNALSRNDAVLTTGTETTIDALLCVPGALVTFAPLDDGAAAAGIYLKDTARRSFVFGHAPGGEGRRVRYEIRRP